MAVKRYSGYDDYYLNNKTLMFHRYDNSEAPFAFELMEDKARKALQDAIKDVFLAWSHNKTPNAGIQPSERSEDRLE